MRAIVLIAGVAACWSGSSPSRSSSSREQAPATTRGLRDLDWNNRTFRFPELRESGGDGWSSKIAIVDGAFTGAEDGNPRWVRIAPPVFGDLDGDRREEALIHVRAAGDNIPLLTFIQVYSADGAGSPRLRATLYGGDRGHNAVRPHISIDASGAVHVERHRALADEDPSCAPHCGQSETWRLQGSALIEDETARARVQLSEEL